MVKLHKRALSFLRYMSWADPFYNWRISRSTCPNCRGRWFICLKNDKMSLCDGPFMTRCLKCGSNITNMSLIPVIRDHQKNSEIKDAYEMSTYGATLNWLNKNFDNVIQSEYYPGRSPGELVDGIRNEDVQKLSFKNETLDLVTSNQVFEHVPDDIAGYSECFRVLRPGGALIFSVPINNSEKTIKAAELRDGEIVHLMEPEYHDSRTEGPMSALVFWHFSLTDICDRVESVGFKAKIVDVNMCRIQGVPAKVIYAVKPPNFG